jgi:hypothetical protein
VFPGVRDKTSVSFRDKTKPSNTGVEASPEEVLLSFRNVSGVCSVAKPFFTRRKAGAEPKKRFLTNVPKHMMADSSPQWMISQNKKSATNLNEREPDRGEAVVLSKTYIAARLKEVI